MSAYKVLLFVLVAALLTTALALALSQSVPGAASVDPGIIAYMRVSTHDMHLISPDGSGDKKNQGY